MNGHSHLEKQRGCVKIKASGLHRRGLFASRPGGFQLGETILLERPLVALQSLPNRQELPLCANCYRFVGSLRQHLLILAGQLERQSMQQVSPEDMRLGTVFSPIVPCAWRCGELYCSEACREEHFYVRGHRLLCVGPISDAEAPSHPLVQFKMHAVQTNEIFLLVADVVVAVMTAFQSNGGNLEAALEPFREFVQRPWWEVATNPEPDTDPIAFQDMLKGLVAESSALLGRAICCPGCEMLFTPEFSACVIGMFEQNNVGIRKASPLPEMIVRLAAAERHAAQNGHADLYVSEALVPALEAMLDDFEAQDQDVDDDDDDGDGVGQDDGGDGCCGDEAHARCGAHREEVDDDGPGMDVGIESAAHVRHHDHHSSCNGQVAAPAACHEQGRQSLNSLWERCRQHDEHKLFVPLDGTALYSIICSMNHSCDPNCEVVYVGGVDGPLVAQVVALRPIQDGEELLQSYIDCKKSLEERRSALLEYSFLCQCAKCNFEQQAGLGMVRS